MKRRSSTSKTTTAHRATASTAPRFVRTMDELAQRCGKSVRSVQRAKHHPTAPRPGRSGAHDVNAWIKFFEANGRDRSTTPELAGLRNRKMLAEVSEKEFKLAAKKLEYVLSREVRAEWERLCGHAATVLRAKFEAELPPILAGLDATGIQAEFRKAIDEVLQALHET